MGSRGGRKSEWNARSDLISELPSELKEKILECLDTRDAARTALLSTHWNHVWLRHGQLTFDDRFFLCVRKSKDYKSTSLVNTINYILLLRAEPVKKFTLQACHNWNLEQHDLDQWCRFLSRNGVQELDLCVWGWERYKLPYCTVSCRTLMQLSLTGFVFDLPINAPSIFPSVTSLHLTNVEFSHNLKGIVYTIPNLEKLTFGFCNGVENFEINAPKLESFFAFGFPCAFDSRWFMHNLKTIKSLFFSHVLLPCEDVEVASLPTAINLQVIQLYELSFNCWKQLTFAMELLHKSPNLCKLKIRAIDTQCSHDDINGASRLLEDPNNCIINQDLKMLNTIKIQSFNGSKVEMLFVKLLLSKSPALETFGIRKSDDFNDTMFFKILRELSDLPRASPKAQIIVRKRSVWKIRL